jgi:hypothetical protein
MTQLTHVWGTTSSGSLRSLRTPPSGAGMNGQVARLNSEGASGAIWLTDAQRDTLAQAVSAGGLRGEPSEWRRAYLSWSRHQFDRLRSHGP